MLETFNSKYTTEELEKGRMAHKKYLEDMKDITAEADAVAVVAA
jgi:hypothetical protein